MGSQDGPRACETPPQDRGSVSRLVPEIDGAAISRGEPSEMPARGSLAVWIAVCGVWLSGCSSRTPPPVPVSGTVTLRGKPLPADAQAFVSFAPVAGGPSVSAAVTSGSYASPHTPQGPLMAFFEITKPLGPRRKSDRTGEFYQETQSLVPARYASGLPVTIEGPTTKDFDLVD